MSIFVTTSIGTARSRCQNPSPVNGRGATTRSPLESKPRAARSNYFLASIAFAGLCLVPAYAFAEYVSISQTNVTYDKLKSDCDAVGGVFSGNQTDATCANNNKGTGVECSFTANGSVCHGWVPKTDGGKPVIGVVQPTRTGSSPATASGPKVNNGITTVPVKTKPVTTGSGHDTGVTARRFAHDPEHLNRR